MTRRRPSYEPTSTPRRQSDYEIAWEVFGFCEETFKRMRPELEAEGFPKKDPLTDKTDSVAAHYWQNQRSGLAAEKNGHDPFLEALK